MNKRKQFFHITILILVGMLFIILYNPNYEKRCFKALEIEKNDEFSGVVVKKYYRNGNQYPRVEIQTSDKEIIIKDFHAEFSGIYEFVMVGDSVMKVSNSLYYEIFREDSITKIKFTKFCNKEEYEVKTMPNTL